MARQVALHPDFELGHCPTLNDADTSRGFPYFSGRRLDWITTWGILALVVNDALDHDPVLLWLPCIPVILCLVAFCPFQTHSLASSDKVFLVSGAVESQVHAKISLLFFSFMISMANLIL